MARNDAPLTDEQRKLIEDNEKSLYFFLNKYMRNYPHLDEGDVLDHIMMAAIKVSRNFNPKLGRWTTLLGHAIRYEFMRERQANNTQMRGNYKTVHWAEDSDFEVMLGEDNVVTSDYDSVISPYGEFWDRAMEFLTPIQKEAVELVYGKGLDMVQAGKLLGIRKQAVFSRIRCALTALRNAIESGELYY